MALRLSFGTEPNLPISPLAPAFQLCRHRHHRRSGLSRRRRRRHLVISSLVVSCVTRAPGFSLPYYILTANTAQASVDCPRLYFLTATRRYVGFISLFFLPLILFVLLLCLNLHRNSPWPLALPDRCPHHHLQVNPLPRHRIHLGKGIGCLSPHILLTWSNLTCRLLTQVQHLHL